jgi:hypothetical protein
MVADVQVFIGVNSHIMHIFLNEGLAREEEVQSIGDKNPEHQMNKIL